MIVHDPIRTWRSGEAPAAEGTSEAQIASLEEAARAVADCRRCPLYRDATQAVFGDGPRQADLMLVGEQPGDREDLEGRAFVGPAGRILDAALERAGLVRGRAYVTNAVKHFKFSPRGKRRLHQKPDAGEIDACRFWLELEIRLVQPRVVVAMGATAIRGVLGRTATVSSLRGKPIELPSGALLLATVHPAYLLRIREPADRRAAARAFEADLRRARRLADEREPARAD